MSFHKHGRVEILHQASRLLADNPLGDPAERDVAVYLPPSYDAGARRFPVVMFLPGYTGSGPALLNRAPWTPSLPERWDRAIAEGRAAEAIVLMPDCFTRYGGSQYLDSPAIGRYASYLTEEVIPLADARLRTIPKREARAVAGKSSGGFGALTLGLERADLFCALASHAGDCAFELSYLRDFGQTLLTLERRGGVRGFLDWFDALPAKPNSAGEVMAVLCNAAAYSPTPTGPYGYGAGFELPFNLLTGALRADVWARWLARDPVRLLEQPRIVDAARSLAAIYLDAGIADEFYLQLGARQLAAGLARAGVSYLHEEFEGGHMNVPYRYARSYEVVTRALAAD
jgi:enterochelin esterase-like enzyme